MMSKEELLSRVAATLSIEQILDLLGWDEHTLVDKLADEIWEENHLFEEAVE